MTLQSTSTKSKKGLRGVFNGSNSMEFDFFLAQTGLLKSWLAAQMGIGGSNINIWLESGFPELRANQLEQIIQDNGKRLARLNISQNFTMEDFKRIRAECGIKLLFFSQSLNVLESSFRKYFDRIDGLTFQEVQTLNKALHSSALLQKNFVCPAHFFK